MRRRLSWAVLGTSGALAAGVAAVMMTGAPDNPPNTGIIVPQAENTEIALPRQSTVDIPEVPNVAATTEISTPQTTGQPKPTPKPTAAPPPSPSPPSTTPPPPSTSVTVTAYNNLPWWYYYFGSGSGGSYGSGGGGSYGGGGGGGSYGGGGGGGHR